MAMSKYLYFNLASYAATGFACVNTYTHALISEAIQQHDFYV